jgi:superfamily II DNA helicase RecQ
MQQTHDFRPDDLRLAGIVDAMRERPVVVALTATAAPPVREEIVEHLSMRTPKIIIRASWNSGSSAATPTALARTNHLGRRPSGAGTA